MRFLKHILSNKVIVIILVMLSLWLPRAFANDQFVSVDEADWVRHSANFYYAIGQKDYKNTFRIYEPAVTTTLVGAVVIHFKFPEYRGFGQGYLFDTAKFNSFLRENGADPLDLLVAGRQVMIFLVVISLLASFMVLWKLVDLKVAVISILLVGFEPYFLGHSRLLTQEALMSALLLLSILSYLAFILQKKILYLIISAGAAGIACLTKSPGTIIVAYVGMITLHHISKHWKEARIIKDKNYWKSIRTFFKPLTVWFLILVLVYIALWPSMWVAPITTLSEVYGTAMNFVIQGDQTSLSRIDKPLGFNFDVLGYLRAFLWHSTPIVWLGFILAFFTVGYPKRESTSASILREIFIYLSFFAGAYILMMAIGSAKSAGHYIMFAHVCVGIIAGFGYVTFLKNVWGKINQRASQIIAVGIVTLVIFIQVLFLKMYFPYYLNYLNPIMGNAKQGAQTIGVGYGEVLDQAAKYLAQKKDAKNLTVMSWYGPGPFGHFFPGETLLLYPIESWSERATDRLARSDYLVIYYQHQVNRQLPSSLLQALVNTIPEHIIVVNGIEYIRIYDVDKLPLEAFEADSES